MTRTLGRFGLALAALTVSATGCTGRACTTIGVVANQGVVVSFLNYRAPTDTQFMLCVAHTCKPVSTSSAQPQTVDLPVPASSTPVQVTAEIVRGSTMKSTSSVSVVPQKDQPNGAGCSPTAWLADVKVDTAGHLIS